MYGTTSLCMHNRYKPTYHNRRNTSIDVISLVSHLKLQGLLLFPVADITLLTASFKSSGILQVTAQKEHWENEVTEKAQEHCMTSCFQATLWWQQLLLLLHLMWECLYGWTLPNQCNFLSTNFLFGFGNCSHNNDNAKSSYLQFFFRKKEHYSSFTYGGTNRRKSKCQVSCITKQNIVLIAVVQAHWFDENKWKL